MQAAWIGHPDLLAIGRLDHRAIGRLRHDPEPVGILDVIRGLRGRLSLRRLGRERLLHDDRLEAAKLAQAAFRGNRLVDDRQRFGPFVGTGFAGGPAPDWRLLVIDDPARAVCEIGQTRQP